MKTRLIKPRAFLSHSKTDIEFINRIAADLRICQIDPWLDDYEIRHGQPWLDAIFEDGLPACDAIVIYLSEKSIASPVVRKEIDAGILQKLRDSQVAFLPYITDADTRTRLRADLQTLQVPIWNDGNYSIMLPRVVAEIWRSFMERTVTNATQKEQVARLRAELQLAELEKKNAEILFRHDEQRDFEFIWAKLDRYMSMEANIPSSPDDQTPAVINFSANIASVLIYMSDSNHYKYDHSILKTFISQNLASKLTSHKPASLSRLSLTSCPNIGNELLMYGLVERNKNPPQVNNSSSISSILGVIHRMKEFSLVYTDKLERFKYWLYCNNLMPSDVLLKLEEMDSSAPQ